MGGRVVRGGGCGRHGGEDGGGEEGVLFERRHCGEVWECSLGLSGWWCMEIGK